MSYLSHAKSVTEQKKNGMISYQDWGDLLLGEENPYSSENLRKAYRIVDLMLSRLGDEITVTEDDKTRELKDLETRIKLETVKIRDQRRELNKLYTSQARFENLRERMEECINNLEPIMLKDYSIEQKEDVSAVLCLSDWHGGCVVDNQFNFYDIKTMYQRAEQLKNKAISYIKLHNVSKLYVEINGDIAEGLIQISSRVSEEENVVEQIMTVSELLSQFINDLKPFVNEIKVVTTLGNHGRIIANKKETVTKENFEMLIPAFLKLRLKDIPIIKSYGEDFVKYKIDNKTIVVAHGQNDKVRQAISDYIKMFKEVIDEVHLGHYHTFNDFVDCDVCVTVNGSLKGTDDYSTTLRKVSKPSQTLIIYGNDRLVYNIVLD